MEVDDEGYDDVFMAEDEKRFGCQYPCASLLWSLLTILAHSSAINSTSSDPLKLNVKRVSKALGEDEDNDDEANDPFAEVSKVFRR